MASQAKNNPLLLPMQIFTLKLTVKPPSADATVAPLTRSEVQAFFVLLNRVATECSNTQVKDLRKWIKTNIVILEDRCEALGKFLVSYCTQLGDGPVAEDIKPVGQMPLARTKRLHVLHVISDVTFHLNHLKESRFYENFTKGMKAHLLNLFQQHVSLDERHPKHIDKLKVLLGFWREKKLFSSRQLSEFRVIIDPNDLTDDMDIDDEPEDPVWDVPPTLGERTLLWQEQPTGCWLDGIDGDYYLRPKDIAISKLPPGKARPEVQTAVEALLFDAKRGHDDFYRLDEDVQAKEGPAWLDDMGEIVYGEDQGMTYYGWPRASVRKIWRDKQERKRSQRRNSRPSASRSQTRSGSYSYSHGSDR